MAVKVWLPLDPFENSNADANYGVTEVTAFLNADTASVPTPSWGSSLFGNGALTFGGTGQYIMEITPLVFSTRFSISFWVKEGANVSVGTPLFSFHTSSARLAACVKTADGYAIPELASGTLFTLANGWNHVVITANGTTINAFVNGVKSTAGDVAQIANVTSATVVIIGGSRTTSDPATITPWKGSMCHFKIYDDVMSLFEIVRESEGAIIHYAFNAVQTLGTGVTLPAGTTAATFGFNTPFEVDLTGNNWDTSLLMASGSADTPMYSSSTQFTNESSVGAITLNTGEFASRYTISVWAKGEGTPITVNDNWSPITVSDTSAWHMYTVANGTLYVDGVASGSASGSFPSGNSLDIKLADNFVGKLSDFRLFGTAFTADQVKALYSRKAAIDNTGKVIASEFIVNDEVTAPAFAKTGVVSSSELADWNSDDLDGVEISTWTENTITPTDVQKFAIYQTSGAVNATDIIEY